MALNGEGIWWGDAASSSSGSHTYTWTVDFPPQAALAKVWTTFFMEYDDANVHMFGAGINSIVRESSTAIQVVPANNDPAIGDASMSSVTFGLYLYMCQVRIVLNVGFYD